MLLLGTPIPSREGWALRVRRLRNGLPGSSLARDTQVQGVRRASQHPLSWGYGVCVRYPYVYLLTAPSNSSLHQGKLAVECSRAAVAARVTGHWRLGWAKPSKQATSMVGRAHDPQRLGMHASRSRSSPGFCGSEPPVCAEQRSGLQSERCPCRHRRSIVGSLSTKKFGCTLTDPPPSCGHRYP